MRHESVRQIWARVRNEPSLLRALRRRILAFTFPLWQRAGVHITPNDLHQPVPDTRLLRNELWSTESQMQGVEMNEDAQLRLLETVVGAFGSEVRALPEHGRPEEGYFVRNHMFGSVDAEMLYGIIRHAKPRRMIEIGSGFSTLLSAQAIDANRRESHDGELIAIDPFPSRFLRRLASERVRLVEVRLETLPLEEFAKLSSGDILFVDSSHVLRIGSDVQYAFLEILPRLRPGVLVHIHDIFLPAEYPRHWVIHEKRFWNEQYLLQALLMFSRGFEVVWAASFMHLHHRARLREAFPSYRPGIDWPASFWIRRSSTGG